MYNIVNNKYVNYLLLIYIGINILMYLFLLKLQFCMIIV